VCLLSQKYLTKLSQSTDEPIEPEHLSSYLKKARATFTATLCLSLGATALATEKVYAGHDVLSHRVICQHGVLSHLSAVRLFSSS
jgi:hypothetical protein